MIDAMETPAPKLFISIHADKRPQPMHQGQFNQPTPTSEGSILMSSEVQAVSKREVICSYHEIEEELLAKFSFGYIIVARLVDY
jgi:hypothetical protein